MPLPATRTADSGGCLQDAAYSRRARAFFPRIPGGLYRRGNAVMAVSRGLGGRAPVPRLHNRPELVLVTLEPEDGEVNP